MAVNKFDRESIVYLAESAKTGSLESFKVLALRQDVDGAWYYRFGVPQRPPTGTGTLGDRITKKFSYDFELAEGELFTLCQAINEAESYLRGQLAKLMALKSQHCSG